MSAPSSAPTTSAAEVPVVLGGSAFDPPASGAGASAETLCRGWSAEECGFNRARKYDAMTRAELAKATAGLSAEGAPIERRMGDLGAVTFQLHRGRCYEVTFRLSADVDERWDLRPVAIPHVTTYEGGDPAGAGYDGFVLHRLCPQNDGPLDVYLTTERGRRGKWRAQLFSAPIAEAELEREREHYETADRRAAVGTWCRSCFAEWARCRLDGDPHCDASYYVCLAAAHLSPDDCERGDTAPKQPPRGPLHDAKADVAPRSL